MSTWKFSLATLLAVSIGCGSPDQPADLVLLNGNIVTLDADQPHVQALAARDGRIVALGTDAEIRRLTGAATETIDLGGRLTIPGFIEGHGHFAGLGRSLMNVRLGDTRSWKEVVERAAEAAADAEPGEWIVGRGWHQEKWDSVPEPQVEGYPTHEALSRVTPDNPVLFSHASGHASIANARALELAGIGRNTPDPPGGTILRDRRGHATGVLRENAEELVGQAYSAAVEERRDELTRRAIEQANTECLAKGVTSFQDAGSSYRTVELLHEAADSGRLDVRVWVMLSENNAALEKEAAAYRVIGADDDRVTVRAIKRLVDGALGAHGAWLLEPYTDLPESRGHNTLPIDDLERTAQIALEHDLQLCVHAIGDRANREVLDLYERAFAGLPDGRELRWRVEHAQHLHPDDIPRFAEMGVIASMQTVHCTSDGPWVPVRLGEQRCEDGAYVWRALMDTGAVISNGTDTPVEDVDPLANFHSAVTRQMNDGRAFYPEQRMERTEALEAATLNAAFAAFEEQIKGSLSPGKLADVVVLSRDILSVPADEIPGTHVVYTIVGGKVLYRGPEA